MVEAVLVGPNVRAAQHLTRLLEKDGHSPRAVVWAYASDPEKWRLWIVPPTDLVDKRAFYFMISGIFLAHAKELQGMNLSDVQYMDDNHPAIQGLRRFDPIEGIGEMRVSHNVLNGYYLPEAIVIHLAA